MQSKKSRLSYPMQFNPPWYMSNRHLQTVVPNILHPAFPKVDNQRLELEDGDFIDLSWGETRASNTLLVLHGLEGSIHSAYAKRILNYCNQHRIAVVLMHFRGCSGEPNRLLRSYHSGETGDLRHVIAHLKLQGVDKIALLGYSLGGNVTLKYMGEAKPDPAIRCAIGVSVPFELNVCADTMNRGFSRIYQWTLLDRMKKKMQQKRNLLVQSGLDFPEPATIRNFVEFDHHFTAPIHGFNSRIDYYQRASSRQYLATIDKPTLIIQSRDDPFMCHKALPAQHELSATVHYDLSNQGGHVGFFDASGVAPKPWIELRVHQFLAEQQFI